MSNTVKTLFQKLDELNKLDSEVGSKYVQVCGQSNVISVDKKGDHGEVKIGVPANIPVEIFQGKDLRMLLVIIDGEMFDKLYK